MLVKDQIHRNQLAIPQNFKRLQEGVYLFGSRKIQVMILKEGLLVGNVHLFR